MSSSKGPLPKYGGPPSKSFYVCQICKRELRRDKIAEHYGTTVELEVLKLLPSQRPQHLARLTLDKRNHTDKVQDYFDENNNLPTDFNNSKFWIKVASSTSSGVNPIMSSFLSGKHSNPDIEDPPAKRQSVEVGVPEEEEDPSDDIEVEVAVGASKEVVEKTEEMTNPIEKDDIKKEIKCALIDALKDPEAAQLLSEQIVDRIQKYDAAEMVGR